MRRPSRREFLKGAVLAGASVLAPYVVPSSALGVDGKAAPSDRITMGIIGAGSRGTGVMGH
jgi:hypothetical protein